MSSSAVINWRALESAPLLPGVRAAVRMGQQMSATLFRLDPGAVVPLHHHPNEEFGQVIDGSLSITVADKTTHLEPGGAFLIPGDVPHSALAGADGCTLLECYAPPRNPDPSSRKEKIS
ncbi:MAG: cupin domain-containing protein [Nakamurella sp.]